MLVSVKAALDRLLDAVEVDINLDDVGKRSPELPLASPRNQRGCSGCTASQSWPALQTTLGAEGASQNGPEQGTLHFRMGNFYGWTKMTKDKNRTT